MGIGSTENNAGRNPDVTIRAHRAGEGVRWLVEGFRLLRQQPLGLPAMAVIYLLMHLPALLPAVGLAIATVLAPFATLGLTSACREIHLGRAPSPAVYTALFKDAVQRRALYRLGIANAILTLIAVALLLALGLAQPTPADTPAGTPNELDWVHIAWQVSLYVPIALLMWFAPMLAGWHGASPAKAIFGSIVACWRNKAAMLVYGLAVSAVILVVTTVMGLIVAALGISTELSSVLIAPIALVMLAVVQAGIYAMYAAIFTVHFEDVA